MAIGPFSVHFSHVTNQIPACPAMMVAQNHCLLLYLVSCILNNRCFVSLLTCTLDDLFRVTSNDHYPSVAIEWPPNFMKWPVKSCCVYSDVCLCISASLFLTLLPSLALIGIASAGTECNSLRLWDCCERYIYLHV